MVGDFKCTCLMDTGANFNVMPRTIYEKLKSLGLIQQKKKTTRRRIRTSNGETSTAGFSISVLFRHYFILMNENDHSNYTRELFHLDEVVEFQVMDHLHTAYDFILGRESIHDSTTMMGQVVALQRRNTRVVYWFETVNSLRGGVADDRVELRGAISSRSNASGMEASRREEANSKDDSKAEVHTVLSEAHMDDLAKAYALELEESELGLDTVMEEAAKPRDTDVSKRHLVELGVVQEGGVRAEEYLNLVETHQVIFGVFPEETKLADATVTILPGAKRVMEPTARGMPLRSREALKITLDKLEANQIIAKLGKGKIIEWLHQGMGVMKPNGEARLVVDLQRFNKVCAEETVDFPSTNEILNSLHGSKVFSKFDCANGFYNIKLAPDSQEYFSFHTPLGIYQLKRLPQGWKNAPAIFTREMYKHLGEFVREGWLVIYMDDILIHSSTHEEHLQHLKRLFEKLAEVGLRMQLEKSMIGRSSLNFLGYVLDEEGFKPDTDRYGKLRDFPIPTTLKRLRGLIGLFSYFRHFISDYGSLIRPLQELVNAKPRNVLRHWTPEHDEAKEKLTDRILNYAKLYYPDPQLQFIVRTDASDYAIGGMLLQIDSRGRERPLAFYSKALQKHERNWAANEREAYAIVKCVKKWASLIAYSPFRVETDHKNLQFLRNSDNPKLMRWRTYLLEMNCSLHYIKGELNVVADALSRCYEIPAKISKHGQTGGLNSELHTMLETAEVTLSTLTKRIIDSQDIASDQMKSMWDLTRHSKQQYLGDNRMAWMKGSNIIVNSEDTALVNTIMGIAHDGVGHRGRDTTLRHLRQMKVWWRGMEKSVVEYIQTCSLCSHVKSNNRRLQNIQLIREIATSQWHTLHLDIIGPLPDSVGHKYILSAICQLTRYAEFIPLQNQSGETVFNTLKDTLFTRYGKPKRLIVDGGKQFNNTVFDTYCKDHDIEVQVTTAYTHHGNGKVERVHRTIEEILTILGRSQTWKWSQNLAEAKFIVNTTASTATGKSPFQVMFGREARTIVTTAREGGEAKALTARGSDSNGVNWDCVRLFQDALVQQVLVASEVSAIDSKGREDHGGESFELKEGTKVFIRDPTRESKLNFRWIGPATIVEKISSVTCMVQKGEGGRITKYHISQLKPVTLRTTEDEEIEYSISRSGIFVAKAVLGHRVCVNRNGVIEFQVRWNDNTTTWEGSDCTGVMQLDKVLDYCKTNVEVLEIMRLNDTVVKSAEDLPKSELSYRDEELDRLVEKVDLVKSQEKGPHRRRRAGTPKRLMD